MQAFSAIDHHVAFNVDIGNNTSEPVDDVNDTIPEAGDNDLATTTGDEDVGGASIISSTNNNLPTTSKKLDFSFRTRSFHSKHHLQNRTIYDIESSTQDTQSGGDDYDSLSSGGVRER